MFQVREGTPFDLVAVLAVQHEAFRRVSEELSIPCDRLPPLLESVADLKTLADAGTRFFVAVAEGEVIGSVRATEGDDAVEIGRLVVAGGWTRRGVATALMDALEAAYPYASRFVLFTGIDARAPLALYESRGYTRTATHVTAATTLVWLEKPGGGAARSH